MMYGQEYELEFITDTEAVFNVALINAAFSDEARPRRGIKWRGLLSPGA